MEKLAEVKEEPGIILQNESSWAGKMDYPSEFIERINGLVSCGGNAALELDRKGIYVITPTRQGASRRTRRSPRRRLTALWPRSWD